MRSRGRSVVLALLLSCAASLPAFAGILVPYVRVDFGANMLDLPSVDQQVRQEEELFHDSGLIVDFDGVGPALGLSGSAGLWLFPGFRVGATWSDARSKVNNHVDLDGFTYADDFQFRMKDVGGEAAIRIPRLRGLTFGGSIAQTKADMSEHYALENVHGTYYETETLERTGRTYGGFIGLDQTNASGLAGYVRVGFQRRDLGSVATRLTITDNGTTTVTEGAPFSLDYTGYYLKAGVGFDLIW